MSLVHSSDTEMELRGRDVYGNITELPEQIVFCILPDYKMIGTIQIDLEEKACRDLLSATIMWLRRIAGNNSYSFACVVRILLDGFITPVSTINREWGKLIRQFDLPHLV